MNIYTKAVAHYGRAHQIVKAAEELSELSAALTKYGLALLEGEELIEAEPVAGELADVEIMLEQLKYALPPEVMRKAGRIKGKKLNRLNKLIQKKQTGGESNERKNTLVQARREFP